MGPIPRSLVRLGRSVGACLQAILLTVRRWAPGIACKQAPTRNGMDGHDELAAVFIKCPGACSGDLYCYSVLCAAAGGHASAAVRTTQAHLPRRVPPGVASQVFM